LSALAEVSDDHRLNVTSLKVLLFERVQRVFSSHDRDKVRGSKHPHFLRGVLTCAACGSALPSLTAKGRYSYVYCLGRFSRRTDCREPYVAQEQLESRPVSATNLALKREGRWRWRSTGLAQAYVVTGRSKSISSRRR
jgi:hypothetical protein